MRNIIYNNEGLRIEEVTRRGRCCYFLLENGEVCKGSSQVNPIVIICSECGTRFETKYKFRYIEKQYLCPSCNKKGERNGFYGKSHTEESRRRISEGRIGKSVGEDNPMYGKSWVDVVINKYGKVVGSKILKDSNQRRSDSVRGFKNPFYGGVHSKEVREAISKKNKEKWKDEDYKKRMSLRMVDCQKRLIKENPEKYKRDRQRAAMVSNYSQKRYRMNNPEKKFGEILSKFSIEYDYSPILKGYQYDFKIKGKRILVEVDGDYWHGNPKLYDSFNHIQVKKKKRDKLKEKWAREHNFNLLRIWESELDDDNKIQEVIDEIQSY